MYHKPLILLFAVAMLPSCARKDQPSQAAAGPRVAAVKVASAFRRDMPVEIRAIGNVEAYSSVAVKSRVAGQLMRVHIRDGQDVRQDQLLFEIDPLPLEAQLRQAEANLARDRALEKQAEASIARSRAQARQARVQADRYATLAKEGISSREQTEQFRSAAEAAEAGVNADVSAVESARAAIRADEARVAEAKLSLGYTKIHAPLSGRAGAVMIKEGNLIKENDTTPLVTILQVTPVYVSFTVPESWIEEIRSYMGVRQLPVLAQPEGAAEPSTGVLDSIDNSVDTTTGTIRLKAKFPNQKLALWPGAFANVIMTLRTEREVLVVPAQAVQNRQEGRYVWIVKPDMTAELRPIEVARTQGELAVISSGVESGESVITEGQLRVTPGAKLTVTKTQTRADLGRAPTSP